METVTDLGDNVAAAGPVVGATTMGARCFSLTGKAGGAGSGSVEATTVSEALFIGRSVASNRSPESSPSDSDDVAQMESARREGQTGLVLRSGLVRISMLTMRSGSVRFGLGMLSEGWRVPGRETRPC